MSALDDRLFQDAAHFDARYVPGLDRVAATVQQVRDRGHRIVLTNGSFDILHEGHSMYLEAARALGDFLVVGVDSDEKIRTRKGPGRPAVPELERLRMVVHQRGVGMVTLKQPDDPKWGLIKAVRPDVLVATQGTYSQEQIDQLQTKYCGSVQVLTRMATISTSARLRLLQFRSLGEQAAAESEHRHS